jgi:hypothetical protein
VQILVVLWAFEPPVLIPAGFADMESITRFLQCRGVLRFVGGLGNDENNVRGVDCCEGISPERRAMGGILE